MYLLVFSLSTIVGATSVLDKYIQSPGNVYHGR